MSVNIMPSSIESDFFSPCSSSGHVTPSKQTTRFYATDYLQKKRSASGNNTLLQQSNSSLGGSATSIKATKNADDAIRDEGESCGFQSQETASLQQTSSSLKLPGTMTSGDVGLRNRRGSNVSSLHGNVINTRKYIREVYGPFLCTLLLISAFLVILGGALMLAGFYVPPVTISHIQRAPHHSNNKQQNLKQETYSGQVNAASESVHKARSHNNALNGLRISGVSMLAIGLIGLTILVLTPIVCLRRTEYSLLPDSDDFCRPRSSFSSASGLPDDMFTFSVVKQHIQPKKKKKKSGSENGISTGSLYSVSGNSNKRTNRTSSKQRSQQHQQHYDKGFLSPELNRGPIFVSDDNFKIRNSSGSKVHHHHTNNDHEDTAGKPNLGRNRSSSFEIRLSPRRSSQQQIRSSRNPWQHSRYSLSGGKLTPDILLTRSGPVKAGSFHSLR